MTSFTTVVKPQLDHIYTIARALDTKGYVVLAHGLNVHGTNSRLYGLYVVATQKFVAISAGMLKRRAHVVDVWFDSKHAADVSCGKCDLSMDALTLFMFKLPKTRRFAELRAMLSLISLEVAAGRGTREYYAALAANRAPLVCRRPPGKKPTYEEFTGRTPGALKLLLQHLDMPEVREVLIGGKGG